MCIERNTTSIHGYPDGVNYLCIPLGHGDLMAYIKSRSKVKMKELLPNAKDDDDYVNTVLRVVLDDAVNWMECKLESVYTGPFCNTDTRSADGHGPLPDDSDARSPSYPQHRVNSGLRESTLKPKFNFIEQPSELQAVAEDGRGSESDEPAGSPVSSEPQTIRSPTGSVLTSV